MIDIKNRKCRNSIPLINIIYDNLIRPIIKSSIVFIYLILFAFQIVNSNRYLEARFIYFRTIFK